MLDHALRWHRMCKMYLKTRNGIVRPSTSDCQMKKVQPTRHLPMHLLPTAGMSSKGAPAHQLAHKCRALPKTVATFLQKQVFAVSGKGRAQSVLPGPKPMLWPVLHQGCRVAAAVRRLLLQAENQAFKQSGQRQLVRALKGPTLPRGQELGSGINMHVA